MSSRGDRPALWRGAGKKSVQAHDAGGAPKPDVSWTDAAKELADEYGIDIATVEGSGAGGNVTKADVQAVVDAEDE